MRVSKTITGMFVAAAAAVGCVTSSATAATLFTFTGVAGAGDVNGVPFSDQPFALRFEVNSAATATSSAPPFAVTGGSLTINNQTLQLAGASTAGRVVVNVSSGGGDVGDYVSINPTSGGYIQFIVGNDVLFPAGFSGTTLGSIEGRTATNLTTDPYNNGPAINFQGGGGGALTEGGPSGSSLVTSGGLVNLIGFASGPNLRDGLWSFSASPIVVPEPTSMMAIAASTLLLGRKRK